MQASQLADRGIGEAQHAMQHMKPNAGSMRGAARGETAATAKAGHEASLPTGQQQGAAADVGLLGDGPPGVQGPVEDGMRHRHSEGQERDVHRHNAG